MPEQSTLDVLSEEVAKALRPLQRALSSPEKFSALLRNLGWTVEDVPPPFQDLNARLNDLNDALDAVLQGESTVGNYEALRQAIVELFESIRGLESASFDPLLAADNFASKIPGQLIEDLLISYLTHHQPRLGFALFVFGLIRIKYQVAIGNRPGHVHRELAWPDFTQLLADPVIVFERAYGWRTADFDVEGLLENILDFMLSIGVPAFLEEMDEVAAQVLENHVILPGNPIRYRINVPILERYGPSGPIEAGIGLFPLPQDGAWLPGLALLPYADASIQSRFEVVQDLFLTIQSDFDLRGGVGIMLRSGEQIEVIVGFDDPASAATAKGMLTVRLDSERSEGEPIVLIGSRDGSRLQLRGLSAVGGLYLDAQERPDLYLEVELQDGRLVIAPGQGDGFLQKILPPDGISATFDLAVGLSTLRGFYLRGSGGLEINLPTHVTLGPIELQSLTIGFQPKDEQLPVNLGASLKTELGPLTAVVQNMGIIATFSFPEGGGNIGPIDLDLGFKPPTGIGLAIDGGGFKGGGFLSFDGDNQRYVGFLELEFKETIAIKALGLLTTRMPDGSEGFSLLIIITAEFQPIQIGFGFTLNGVGGLLGLNRTANVERLRTGIRDNTLSSILFPQNIVANANRIISDLRQVFPPQPDRFIFGPMAKIGWGTPTLLTIDLGLLIEVPDPVRVVILGVVRALLPDEEAKLLQLQVNFLGVIDFEAQLLAFDASLYDSKLLTYTLSGDMALRLSWGADPNFLLTVGGFHPAYDPPPMALPDLRRLSLQLLDGDNPRLTLETYFAITSNTVQFGARLELYAASGKFNVYGFLSFDVLFQFNPFYFIADIGAMLALRVGSSSIASISLSLTLEGPTPWHAKGTATLKLCWFIKIKVRFNKTFGQERDTRLDDVAVLPLLKAALSHKGNWEAQIPDGRHMLVSLKEIEASGDQVVAHPFGVLTIKQKVVPLNINIQKFGNQWPSDGNRFAIEQVQVGEPGDTETLGTADVQEYFAPAQFFEKSDAQKLSGKSFEHYDGGVKLAESEEMDADYAARRVVEYELFYIDEQRNQRLRPWFELLAPEVVAFNAWASKGAIAASPLSFANKAKSALAPDAVQVSQERFAVVNMSDLRPVNGAAVVASEAGAYSLMNEVIRDNPALEGEIQVVPTFEVNRS